jgi:hypothetical protein
MNKKVTKILELIKKSYAQPLVFHTLMNHLSYIMDNLNPLYEIQDDWSKIIIYSSIPNRIPNQGLDSKILNLLKKLRKDEFENDSKLKLMIILYYMKNRCVDYLNHMIVFELVTNFLGFHDFFDGMILSIFCTAVNSNLFGIKQNKKYRLDSVQHMLKIVKQQKLSEINKYIALPLYIQYDISYKIPEIDIQNDLSTFCMLESLCLYAKYSKNESFIEDVIPKNDLLLPALNKFINKEFKIETGNYATNLCLEDKEIYNRIEKAFNLADDKIKFKDNLLEFIHSLK